MKSFENRVAVVTGAASGMGRALACALAAEGAHIAVCDVNAEGLAATAAAASESRPGVRVTTHLVDVSDARAMHDLAADVRARHGGAHLVFNNAGVSVTDSAEHLSRSDFEWLMGINFWGVVNGTQAFLPLLREADAAHIVNTASIFGVVAFATQSAYNASKFAVRGYTEALRQDLTDSHIRVSCVLPGGVKTAIVANSRYRVRNNAAPTREELAAQFERIAGLTADQAAAIILRGVRRDRPRILVGKDARMLDWLARALPARYGDLVQWIARRFASTTTAGRSQP